MWFSKTALIAAIIVVVISLSLLLNLQYQIVKRDLDTNNNQMGFAIPSILSEVYDSFVLNEEINILSRDVVGTKEFDFSKDTPTTDPLETLLKNEIDRVLSLNYPQLDYTVNGFVSSEYGCLIHTRHKPNLPKAKKVFNADNHLCFCFLTDNTLDISMTYANKEATVLSESSNIISASLVLVSIIIIAFGYTIYTINRQKKLSELKKDFINTLTHEFKTPIFSISLAAKSLQETDQSASDRSKSYINLIGNEAKRLQTQVDKVLQIALMESGNFSLDYKEFNLHQVIEKVIGHFKIDVQENKAEIVTDLRASKSIIVADETHISNVLFNLIDNAQKYSEGNPRIEIDTSNHENGVLIVVRDYGIGIDKESQKLVFDQFFRVQTGNAKGFGLGLSYVKHIIDLHKGWVRLESEVGAGTIFRIFLPLMP